MGGRKGARATREVHRGDAGASYALIRARSFVLDARFDLVSGTSTTFGSLGIGVNIN